MTRSYRQLSLLILSLLLFACAPGRDYVPRVVDGDADRGREALARYECGVCHVIPGVADAVGNVGPALSHYSRRSYVAGKFPNEPDTLVRWIVITISLTFLGALLLAPLAAVFTTALHNGWVAYFQSFADPDTRAAIRLTLTTAAVVVPLNTLFGITAAWCIAKFEFKGKSFLITLIDLPLAVSPVVSGLIYVLLFGLNGWFGA